MGQQTQGGAIFAEAGLTIKADNGESVFSGNKVKWADGEDSSAIYLAGTGATLKLNAINNAINMVRTIAANPKKYADYNARVAAGFESPDMATGFVLGGDNSAYWTYSSVVNSMGELYNKYEYQRAQAQKKLLNALKSMKYKNAGNILKDLYYPFLSPEKFAVKSQKQK